MQRHGGSNRSIPKTKPFLNGRPDELPVTDTQRQVANGPELSAKPENPAAGG